MIGFLRAKFLGYAAIAVVAVSLGGALWYAGGSKCRSGIAEANLKHERAMTSLRDELALKHAKTVAGLVHDRATLEEAAETLVLDLQVCSYSHDALVVHNNLRHN